MTSSFFLPFMWSHAFVFILSILPHGNVKVSNTSQFYMESQKQAFPETIKVLSFNTWGLPITLPGYDQARRFPLIPDSLLAHAADIVCLQETFHPDLRAHLIAGLGHCYHGHQDYRCSTEIVPFLEKDCFGGLMTLSKYPIITEYFFRYPVNEYTSMIERIGAKGFLFSVIRVGTETMNVINTHLYAGYDASSELRRKEQIEFMDGILKIIPEYRLFPTIFAGDLNAQHPDMACSAVYDYVATEMGFTDSKPHIDRNDLTSDASVNDYIAKKEIPSKLDYIFIKSSDVASLCVVKSGRCFSSGQPVSDHFGWSALLSFSALVSQTSAEWVSSR